MLATLPLTFMLGSIGVFDMVFTAFLFGAIAFALVAALRNRPRLQYVSYVLLSLAVMTKGPVALVLAGVFFLAGLACGREIRTALLSLRWMTGAVLCVVLSLPWFVWMYYALGLALRASVRRLPATCTTSRSHSRFRIARSITRCMSRPSSPDFFPGASSRSAARSTRFGRWRARIKIPPEEILLWVVGRRGVRLFQHRPVQSRSLCLSRRAGVLPARGARVDERQRLPARSRCRARQRLRALVGRRARSHSRHGRGAVIAFSLFDLGLDLPRAALLIPISLAAGRRGAGGDHPSAQSRVAGCVFGAVLVMLLVIYGSVVAIGLPVLERARPTEAVADSLRPNLSARRSGGAVPARKMAFQPSVLPRAAAGPAAEPVGRQRNFITGKGDYILMLDEDFARLRKDGINLRAVSERPAVTGTTGKGLRRQKWGALVVATSDDTPRMTETPADGSAICRRSVRDRRDEGLQGRSTRRISLRAIICAAVGVTAIAAEREWQKRHLARHQDRAAESALQRAVARSEQQPAANGNRPRDSDVRHRHQYAPPRAAPGRHRRHAAASTC